MGSRAPRALSVAALALALAAPAAALPQVGVLRPGESLAGVRIGSTKSQVVTAWGKRHGVCRECARPTWYFNLRPFHPEGAGVILRRGRVVQAFTVWRPPGWHTAEGVVLGAKKSELTATYGGLHRTACTGYEALLAPSRRVTTVYYVLDGSLWGFGLMPRRGSPCL